MDDDRYNRGRGPILASVVSDPIRDLINSKGRGWSPSLGELGRLVVEKQLEIHREAQAEAETRNSSRGGPSSLLEQSAAKIVESFTGSDEDLRAISSIPGPLARKAIWESEKLPYHSFRSLKRALESEEGAMYSKSSTTSSDEQEGLSTITEFKTRDIDEWILSNERALRDDRREDWRYGLVDWSVHAADVLPDATLSGSTRLITRHRMSGYRFLDEMRPKSLAVLSSFPSFQSMFNKLIHNVLKDLDWNNIFIAGGIVLSALCCADDSKSSLDQFVNSDIDLYIHGLGPKEANEKIKHVFACWKSNLPDSATTMVVRNSRTITFFSNYPTKRLQIVLKLVKNPKEVLLNFDLDVCAMGYDGTSLWLLPRAARALETGYNVFTTNLVEGHYLGERRASQESRVFKYADKGYGIRILPSYIDSLTSKVYEHGYVNEKDTPPVRINAKPDIKAREAKAIKWTHKGINRYIAHGWGEVGAYSYGPNQRNANGKLEFTHAMLEERSIVTAEPGGRSCLTSFELLMRHVELWREKVRGHIEISKEEWAVNNYDVGPTGYDDSPVYTWDANFNFDMFTTTLDRYNEKDRSAFDENIERLEADANNDGLEIPETEEKRISYGVDISSVLSSTGDNSLVFFMAQGFADYANKTICNALREHDLLDDPNFTPIEVLGQVETREGSTLEAVQWKVNCVLAWQQIDRRIDEVNEILWSFYRSHNDMRLEDENRARKFFTEISRRAIRPTPTDEYIAFAAWITRDAPMIGYSYGGFGGQGFFGWSESDDEDDNWPGQEGFNMA